ncbi:hypothetical protein MSAN_01843700 [Mycena sanguinolenta]|uniref:Transmembrane protein n=1 Tax=Mycena sanguinolenta TaxID=230812 RepID=A0A8H6XSZ1_9AGAR|nr:hypothetical protein MSAN_01843700 [Mycena sanguinolenta]
MSLLSLARLRSLHLYLTIWVSYMLILLMIIAFIFMPPLEDPAMIYSLEGVSLAVPLVIILRRLLAVRHSLFNLFLLQSFMVWVETLVMIAVVTLWFKKQLVYNIRGMTGFVRAVLVAEALAVALDLMFLLLPKNFAAFSTDRLLFFDGFGAGDPPCCTGDNILPFASLAHPFFTGESRWIIGIRSLLLLGLAALLPVYVFYEVILEPTVDPIYTREYKVDDRITYLPPTLSTAGSTPVAPVENAVILSWAASSSGLSLNGSSFSLNVNARLLTSEITTCNIEHVSIGDAIASVQLAERPVPWARISNVSITADFSNLPLDYPQSAIYVAPGSGGIEQIMRYTDPIPLLRGTNLLGMLSWTYREVYPDHAFGFLGSATKKALTNAELRTLYPNPTPVPLETDSAALSLIQYSIVPTRNLQDYLSETALDGISSLGGLWTFLNGVFSLFFGASIFYFLCGTRPQAALGLVHIFNKSKYEKNLRADFPAFYSENTAPAGVGAFCRQRLFEFPKMVVTKPAPEAHDDVFRSEQGKEEP